MIQRNKPTHRVEHHTLTSAVGKETPGERYDQMTNPRVSCDQPRHIEQVTIPGTEAETFRCRRCGHYSPASMFPAMNVTRRCFRCGGRANA